MTHDQGKCIGIFSNTFWSIYNFRKSLIRRLFDEGYEVIVISADDKYRVKLEEMGCETVVIKNFDAQSTDILKEARLLRRVIKTLRALPCEYIYTFTIKPNLYTALTKALTGKKVILTVNGLGNVFSTPGIINTISLKLFKRAFRQAYKVVFQNREDFAFFQNRIGLDDDKVLFVRGSGVDTNEFAFSQKPKSPDGRLVFLMACRLLKEKGIFEYIEAAKHVKANHPNAEFWLLGMEAKNPSSIRKQDLAKYSEQGIIKMLQPTDDVNSLLEEVDVLVLPSFYNEGVPRILLEGLSKGLPIITTDSVGCRETVTDNVNGFLIEPRSSKALEEAIRKMISLPPEKVDAMQKESRRLAETEFNEQKVIENYLTIIKRPALQKQIFEIKPLGTR